MRLATRIIHSHKKSIKLQEINNSPKEKEVKAKPVNNPSFTRQPVNFCLVLSCLTVCRLRPDIDVGLCSSEQGLGSQSSNGPGE